LESIVEVVFELLADLLLFLLFPFELFAEFLDGLPCLVELRRYLGGRALGFGCWFLAGCCCGRRCGRCRLSLFLRQLALGFLEFLLYLFLGFALGSRLLVRRRLPGPVGDLPAAPGACFDVPLLNSM
jgi:hypothetical protein